MAASSQLLSTPATGESKEVAMPARELKDPVPAMKAAVKVKPDVLFIGAGPVGLFTAIQAKLYNPSLTILMIERHRDYLRNHVLNLEQESFKGTHPDPAFQAMIKKFDQKILTIDLENQLKAFAIEKDIKFEYRRIEDCKSISEEYGSAALIVGSDGARSVVRKQVFGDELKVDKTLNYIVDVKYKVKGATRPLSFLKETVPSLSYVKHIVSEHVGKPKEIKTPDGKTEIESSVTLRLIIDKATFTKMAEAKADHTYTLRDRENMDANLVKSIQGWLEARRLITGEVRKPDKDGNMEKITAVHLSVYRSKDFVKEKFGKTWILVGDSAFGVPFFRSLNNGIICAIILAVAIYHYKNNHLLEDHSSSFSKAPVDPLRKYHHDVDKLANREIFKAKVKNAGLTVAESSVASVRKVPISRSKLDNDVRVELDREFAEPKSTSCRIL